MTEPRYLYLGDKKHCCVTAAYIPPLAPDDTIPVGFALLKDGDNFNKKLARTIALGRMQKGNANGLSFHCKWQGNALSTVCMAIAEKLKLPNTRHYRKLVEGIMSGATSCSCERRPNGSQTGNLHHGHAGSERRAHDGVEVGAGGCAGDAPGEEGKT